LAIFTVLCFLGTQNVAYPQAEIGIADQLAAAKPPEVRALLVPEIPVEKPLWQAMGRPGFRAGDDRTQGYVDYLLPLDLFTDEDSLFFLNNKTVLGTRGRVRLSLQEA